MSFLQNPSLSLSPPLHSQRHQLQYNPYVSAYSTVTTAPTATTLLTSAPIPSHPPHTFFPPFFMDTGPTVPNQATTTNNAAAASSPTTSNASILSTTVVNAQPQPPSGKKKQGRGPGKKDIKDKPAVSVRWDDGDLTDRLISAVEKNERWLGVFAQSSNDPNAARTAAPVAKRDLQREIARYLFGKDPRYDLDDRKVLESLAVSVKNKLFKLTTLYTECKQELGQLCTLKDERDLIPGSDAAATWARVKEKFPQYTRIRESMSRVGSPSSTPRPSGPDASVSPPHVGHSPISPVLRQRDTNAAPLTNGQVHHTSLKGTIDFPREASHSDPTSIPSAQYATTPAAMSLSTIPSPTYTISNSTMPLSAGYPSGRSGQRRMTSSSTAPPNSSRPSTAVSQAASAARQHSPQHHTHTAVASSATRRPTPYSRPSLPAATMNEMQAHLHAALDVVPEYDDPRDPSPPLSATIQHIVGVLTERKERERSRAHELEVLRMKREEADKARWHQREMMRLKIQLLRAERAAAANTAGAASTPTGTSQLGGVEEDLAIAAGLGDDQSMEGDGEGELDEDIIYDPEPGARPQALPYHEGASTR